MAGTGGGVESGRCRGECSDSAVDLGGDPAGS